MTELSELRWFSAVAERIVEPVFREIAAELMAEHPGYMVEVSLDASPYRRETWMRIRTQDLVRHPLREGSLFIRASSPGEMSAERSFRWLNSGMATADPYTPSDLPDENLRRLARAYADDFFCLVEQAP